MQSHPSAPVRARFIERAREAIRFHPREAMALGALGALLFVGGVIAYARARPVAAAPLAPVAVGSVVASPSQTTIWVDVVGAVRKPGVYSFAQGARVFDAIKAAGGFARGAERAAINLARVLVDGEQIVVPTHGEAVDAGGAAGAGGGAGGGKVNINLADLNELETLPGIGPVLAQKIVDYRTQHGPFHSIQDLLKVSGIGQKKFDSLSALITV